MQPLTCNASLATPNYRPNAKPLTDLKACDSAWGRAVVRLLREFSQQEYNPAIYA